MSVKREIEVESEFAKGYIMNCNDLDEDYKRIFINLIDTSTMATNGISQEEKIQKITESIQKLAVAQIGLIKSVRNTIIQTLQEQNKDIDKRIIDAITIANKKQCEGCKALGHANEVEKEHERQKIIDDFMKKSGITVGAKKNDETEKPLTKSKIFEETMQILIKPYIWIFGSILVFSPSGFNIVKLLIDTFVTK